MQNIVTSNKQIMGGTPCIRGTRIPVSTIQYLAFQEYYSPEKIVECYPHLTLETVNAVLQSKK